MVSAVAFPASPLPRAGSRARTQARTHSRASHVRARSGGPGQLADADLRHAAEAHRALNKDTRWSSAGAALLLQLSGGPPPAATRGQGLASVPRHGRAVLSANEEGDMQSAPVQTSCSCQGLEGAQGMLSQGRLRYQISESPGKETCWDQGRQSQPSNARHELFGLATWRMSKFRLRLSKVTFCSKGSQG